MKNKIFIMLLFMVLFFPPLVVSADEIEEEIYTITSSLTSSAVVDLSGGRTSNSSNIQIYQENNTEAQQWKFTKTSDGYYNIMSTKNKNYVLDISGGKFKNSTNVQLYRKNGTNAQKWKIEKLDNGYYQIISYDKNYVLDVSGGKYYNGTNIQIYKNNRTNAQKFLLNKVIFPEKTVDNGIYNISFNNDYALDLTSGALANGTNIQIYKNLQNNNQKWEIKYLDNGYYAIRPYGSIAYALDVKNASKVMGANLQLYSHNNSDAQQWFIKDTKDGYYKIISKRNGFALEIENNNYVDNENVFLSEERDIDSQKLKITKIENFGTQTIEDGYYFIYTRLSSLKMFDIKSGSMIENNNVQLYDANSTIAQKWYIKYIEDGYYVILSNKDENFALTSDSLDTSNVKISSYNNLNTQKWIIKDNGNGYYTIFNKNMKAIDIASGSTSNGANVQLYESNETNAQQIKFIKTAENISERPFVDGYYFIESALSEDKVVDLRYGNIVNGTNVFLYDRNSTKAQKWYVSYVSNGYYKITSGLNSSKSLDVSGASSTEGSNVQIYQSNSSFAQQWVLKDAGDGYFYILSNCNGLYLDIDNGLAENESNIEMNHFTGNSSQKFRFVKTRLENLVIDVSEYQKEVDWVKVKNYGIYGVILRIGYLNIEDTKFAEYITKIKELKIPYGIYLFSYATDMGDVNKEATFVKNMMTKYNLNPTLGIYYDLEEWGPTYDGYYSAMNTPNEYDQFITEFVKQVKSSYSNYEVKVYASTNYANGHFGDIGRSYVGWIAEWNSVCNYNGYYKMWQYSNRGQIPGINTFVDLNYYYLD